MPVSISLNSICIISASNTTLTSPYTLWDFYVFVNNNQEVFGTSYSNNFNTTLSPSPGINNYSKYSTNQMTVQLCIYDSSTSSNICSGATPTGNSTTVNTEISLTINQLAFAGVLA